MTWETYITHIKVTSNVVWAMAVDVVVDDYNDQAGVVIGNEAVWNRLSGPQDLEPRLLGMDLLR